MKIKPLIFLAVLTALPALASTVSPQYTCQVVATPHGADYTGQSCGSGDAGMIDFSVGTGGGSFQVIVDVGVYSEYAGDGGLQRIEVTWPAFDETLWMVARGGTGTGLVELYSQHYFEMSNYWDARGGVDYNFPRGIADGLTTLPITFGVPFEVHVRSLGGYYMGYDRVHDNFGELYSILRIMDNNAVTLPNAGFEEFTPTPEPATIFLLGPALALVFRYRSRIRLLSSSVTRPVSL